MKNRISMTVLGDVEGFIESWQGAENAVAVSKDLKVDIERVKSFAHGLRAKGIKLKTFLFPSIVRENLTDLQKLATKSYIDTRAN